MTFIQYKGQIKTADFFSFKEVNNRQNTCHMFKEKDFKFDVYT